MLPSTIRSRPVYDGLLAMPHARRNLVAAEGEGTRAVLRMITVAPPGFAGRTHLLCADTGGWAAAPDLDRLRVLGTGRIDVVPAPAEVLQLLDGLLNVATMGTRLYVAGTEGFVGRVVRLGIDHGIDHKSVRTEHSGSLARRVQCVHCKHVTEGVTVSVFECPGCGNLLFVRDHYSRRLAAFQGVCVNAEDPNERPPAEQAYP